MKTTLRVTLTMALAACAAPSAQRYAQFLEQPPGASWKSLTNGSTLAVYASHDCNAKWARTASELHDKGQPLRDAEWARGVTLRTVLETSVDSDAGVLALKLGGAGGGGEPVWVGLGGDAGHCVWQASPVIESALKMTRSKVVFAPWRAQCGAIEVAGTAVDAALIENDPGVALDIDDVIMEAPSALEFGKKSEKLVPWLRAKKGTLHVRADVASGCFVPPASPDATPPADGLGLVRLEAKRCHLRDAGHHVECRTSLGTWEGHVTNAALSLRFVRRTLGTLHLVDGKPMMGGKFAKVVVALTLAPAKSDSEKQVYAALERTVASALAGDEIRVSTPGDPAVTLNVAVAVHDVVVGDVQRRETTEQSEYVDHMETKPNPDKPAAQNEVTQAQSGLQTAEQNAQKRAQERIQARDACLNACNNFQDANQANICRSACQIVGSVADMVSSDSDVVQAKQRLANAQTKLASTPDTIEVEVKAKWPYKKTQFARPVSLRLETEATYRSGPQKTVDPFQFNLEDYEVGADKAHNVEGHQPNRDILGAPEKTIPLVANAVATRLGANLRATLSRDRQEAAALAFREAGGAVSKPEFQGVDAIAFETVGPRLRKATERGTARVAAKEESHLPASRADLAEGECLLAVAVAAAPESAQVALLTSDHAHGDMRGQSFAVIEMCPGDTAGPPGDLLLRTSEDAQVRWGLYLTTRAHKEGKP